MVTVMRPTTTQLHPPTELDVDGAVMHLLHEHVPLALLCDLTSPEGPPSAEILAEEGEPETRWWEQ